jgi:uncharacterized protein (UPF0212 family)
MMNKKNFGAAGLAVVLLAGCRSTENPEESASASMSGQQGCDIFEECGEEGESSSLAFQEAYESLNGTSNSTGTERRSVSIPAENPFVEIDGEQAASLLEEGETFYLYIGDESCPWCRSVIEQACVSAEEAGISIIYYVQIWDDEGNEVLRDEYQIEDGTAVQTQPGTEAYQTLLEAFDGQLDEYILSDDEGNEVDVGEKRIYAPTFFYVEEGTLVRSTTGISSLQEDAYQELDEAILQEEKALFTEFFGA